MREQLTSIFSVTEVQAQNITPPVDFSPLEKEKYEKLALLRDFGLSETGLYRWLHWEHDLSDCLDHFSTDDASMVLEHSEMLQAFSITADQILDLAFQGSLKESLEGLAELYAQDKTLVDDHRAIFQAAGMSASTLLEGGSEGLKEALRFLREIPLYQYAELRNFSPNFRLEKIIMFFCSSLEIPCSMEEAILLYLFTISPEYIVQYHEEKRLKFFLGILKQLGEADSAFYEFFSEEHRNMRHALQMLRFVRWLGPQSPEIFTLYSNWLWLFSEALHLIKSLRISPEQLLKGVQEVAKHEKFDLPFETILRLIQAGCLRDTLEYLDTLDAENSEVKKIITYLCTLNFNLAPFEKLEDFFTWIKDDPNFLQLYWLKVYLLHSTMITSCPMITPQWMEEHLEVFLKISQLQFTFPKILAIPSVEILEFIATLKDDQISEFLKLYAKLSEKHEECIPILTALHPRVAYSTLSKILRLTGSLGLALPKLLDFFNEHPMGKVLLEGGLLNIDEALAKKIQFFAREPHEALWFQDLLAYKPEVIRVAFKVLSTEDFEYLKMYYEELTIVGKWPDAEIWRLVLSKSGMTKLKHIIEIAAAFKQRYADYAISHSLIEFYINYQPGVNQSNFTFLVLKCRQIAQNVDIDAYVCARRFFDISHPWREICMRDLNFPPEDSWLRRDEGYKFIQILQFGHLSVFEGPQNRAALSALLVLPLWSKHWFFEEIVAHLDLIEAIGLSLPQVLKIKEVTDNSACLTVIQQEIVDIQAIAPELFLTAIHRCVLRVVEQFPDLPLTYFLRGLSLFSKAVTEEFLAISLQRLPEAKEFCQHFARLGEQASGPSFFASTSISTCPADLALELMMFLDSPAPGPE